MNVKKKILINTNNVVAALELKNICEHLEYSSILYKASLEDLKPIIKSLRPSILMTDIKITAGQDIISEAEKVYNEINLPIIFFTIEPAVSFENRMSGGNSVILTLPFTGEEIIHSINILAENSEYF